MTQLDRLLPRWHHRERHRLAWRAPPAVALAAVRAVTWREVPAFRLLSFLASLGRGWMPGGAPVLGQLVGGGFRLLHDGDDELVIGAIVRVIRPRASVPLGEEGGASEAGGAGEAGGGGGSAGEFRAFRRPGCYKVALSFRATTGSLCTETRVWATDEVARRRTRRHWLMVRLPSGAIRREWLRAARRRARRR